MQCYGHQHLLATELLMTRELSSLWIIEPLYLIVRDCGNTHHLLTPLIHLGLLEYSLVEHVFVAG